jgi:MraZ protein
VVGAIDRIEVWNPAGWEQYSTEKEPAFAELNQTLFPGG